MKRICLALAASAVAFASVYAQSSRESGLGIRAAWDLNTPSTNYPGLDNGSGFSAGVFYDVPLGKNFFFEPGVSFFYDTMDSELFDEHNPWGNDGTLRNVGFRVPVYFGYKFYLVDNISISAFTGPQFNLGLSLEEHYDDYAIKKLYDKGWNRFDAQWMFGLRLHYLDNFIVEIGGGPGLTNMIDDKKHQGFHLRRNVFTIGVGYIF